MRGGESSKMNLRSLTVQARWRSEFSLREGLFQATYCVENLRGIPVAVTYGTQMNSPIRPNNIGRWQALNLPLFEGIRINIHMIGKLTGRCLEKPFNLSRCITKINPDQQDIFL